jgi:hypothetical protein
MMSGYQPPILKCKTLAEAVGIWLARKVQERKRLKTIECCRSYLKALLLCFADTRLYQIDIGSVIAYRQRAARELAPAHQSRNQRTRPDHAPGRLLGADLGCL